MKLKTNFPKFRIDAYQIVGLLNNNLNLITLYSFLRHCNLQAIYKIGGQFEQGRKHI